MKALFLLLAALSLASCVEIDDFGSYWDQASVDPDLLGTWHELQSPGDAIQIADANGITSIVSLRDHTTQASSRTLSAGRYHFLLTLDKKPGGHVVRYEVKDGVATFYDLDADVAQKYFKRYFSNGENTSVVSAASPSDGQKPSAPLLKIKKFDDTAYEVLASLPGDDATWHVLRTYQKSP